MIRKLSVCLAGLISAWGSQSLATEIVTEDQFIKYAFLVAEYNITLEDFLETEAFENFMRPMIAYMLDNSSQDSLNEHALMVMHGCNYDRACNLEQLTHWYAVNRKVREAYGDEFSACYEKMIQDIDNRVDKSTFSFDAKALHHCVNDKVISGRSGWFDK